MSISSTRSPDISVVEASYRLDVDDATWLRSITQQMSDAFQLDCGIAGYTYDSTRTVPEWIQDVATYGDLAPGTEDFLRQLFSGEKGSLIDELVTRHASIALLPPVSTVSALLGTSMRNHEGGALVSSALGIGDVVTVNCSDGTGWGAFFHMCAPSDAKMHPRRAHRLSRIAAHIAAGGRLRRSLTVRGTEPDAILSREGKVVHASNDAVPALDMLRDAVRRMRAREEASATPDEVIDAWQALHSGRWSLVDRWEEDGRHFVAAYENAPDALDPRKLSPTERTIAQLASGGHGVKLIAYELGLSVGTVTGTLVRITEKLGLRGRVDLARFVQELTRARVQRIGGDDEQLVILESAASLPIDASLSDAERAVVQDALAGLSNHEIAERRGVGMSTVGKQLGSAFKKLGVRSRAELAVFSGGDRTPTSANLS